MTAKSRRVAERKVIEGIEVSDLTVVNQFQIVARHGRIIDASRTGFLVSVNRKDLVPLEFKTSLSLEALVAKDVVLYLPQMNIDLDGRVVRAKHVGRGVFHIGVEFSYDVPEYWRECLIDLLPAPGEFT